ncbi:amino acid permease [Romboutsia lituseburensis]|uniref:Amino acid/polyamine/organocation transporter, APC superfamily n=1 Tax=Romboutsia lituseburensis DSM 797 TaxID=1121325 RepID=A0A1G9N4W4_9FIRM|nr:amino acid permease [Romboutsia lituseburensis]CEH34193.1 Cationic amino acid transporter 9, chloroplastic [Romboutsia lituseburensis]SDL81510.1 amino acid/polyamine/organocation transporter, APC superfamily [Romboutsia lituseburensis DSM 797]
MKSDVFRKMPVEKLLSHNQEGKGLKKVLGAFELTMLGIGAIIGTGIFVLTGVAAADYAGPALILSFIISGIACAFAALCYAELSAMIPISGSAYTFGYVGLGEIWGWLIGWDLILEYCVAVAAVSIGWSGYIVNILNILGIHLPKALIAAPGSGGIINLPAILILALIAGLLLLGAKESAKLNNILVAVKIAVVLLFIILGFKHVEPANWHPFMPYGWSGVFSGAAIVFFAYIGFDAVATAAEEVKNPQKDLPKGIIGSLLICTVLYIVVSAILTGMVPYLDFKDNAAPVAYALSKVGIQWGSALVSVGAVCGITSVLLVMMYGSTRLFYALSRDGLLPKVFSQVSQKSGAPTKSIALVFIATALVAGFFPIGKVAELTNMGTLAAFVIVSLSVIVLRKSRPDLQRPFKVPFVPVVPILAVVFCLFLILQLPTFTKMAFLVWISIGFIVYVFYGYKHSSLNEEKIKS